MKPTKTVRALLVISSLVAIVIGASILAAPVAFQASNGIELGSDPSQLSEVRASGGALLALGALMLVGVFTSRFTLASTAIAAAVYLGYGASRLIAIALDGAPANGLLFAAALELVIGLASVVALVRGVKQASNGVAAGGRLASHP